MHFYKKVKRDLDKLKTQREFFYFKTQEQGRAGIPDLILCINGHFIGLELKGERPGTGPSKLQTECLWNIADAGGTASVVWPEHWDAFLTLIKTLLFSTQTPSKPLMAEKKDRSSIFNNIELVEGNAHIDQVQETLH